MVNGQFYSAFSVFASRIPKRLVICCSLVYTYVFVVLFTFQAQSTRPSALRGKANTVNVDPLPGETVPPAQRLYEGVGSVAKLASSGLRGKRYILH